SEIAVYETVKIRVAADGAEVYPYNAPILTNRPAIIRVFTKIANKKYRARPIVGELHLIGSQLDETVITDTRTLANSNEDALDSTLRFKIDLGKLEASSKFFVVLKDAAAEMKGEEGATIRYPEEDSQALHVTNNPGVVNVRIVPVKYNADMSGRLP